MKEKNLIELLDNMTITEKIGQLSQLAGYVYDDQESDITGPLNDLGIPNFLNSENGSIVGSSGAKITRKIQKEHMEKSRLKIPLLFMADIIHGYRTIFPIPLAIASSWNTALAEKSAEIAAKEASAAGIHVTFSPMVDLVRDPRWGRVLESPGEDSYLNEQFARAFTKGYQGENLTYELSRIAACVKHFAGYGAIEGGREYNTVRLNELDLKEDHLGPFKGAIEEGVEMVMTSFNTINGIPATGNKYLMKDILREELGFEGVLISDWNSIQELISHGIAESIKDAAKLAIKAGVDIDMMSISYAKELENLVNDDVISEELLDESVMRVLTLKNKLGLFENPYRGADENLEKKIHFSTEHQETALKVAEESIILLKNNGTLPLKANQKIALIGPFINESNVLGTWSWKGRPEEAVQLVDAIEKRQKKGNFEISKGSNLFETDSAMIENAIQVAQESDVIVLALGEHFKMSGEASSRTNLQLPQAQLDLIQEMKKLEKPIVVCLFNGRPLDLSGVYEEADALLETWFLGSTSGEAIAKILFGEENPSGKTTMSFPHSVGQIPVYYNHFNTGRPLEDNTEEKWVSRYLDAPNNAKIPFGFGLSYTSFEYSSLKISNDTFTETQPITVSVIVTNTGEVDGKEVVQFYVQDMIGETVRPVNELKGFEKIHLKAGEKKEVTFKLTEKMVRYYHQDLIKRSEKGTFKLTIGPSSVEGESVVVSLLI